jgi:hypothetical protein
MIQTENQFQIRVRVKNKCQTFITYLSLELLESLVTFLDLICGVLPPEPSGLLELCFETLGGS